MISEINNSETDVYMFITAEPFQNYECRIQDKKLNFDLKTKPIQKKKKAKPFTKEEDQLLLLQVVRIGKRFEAIARNFPKRSKHELKNRYYTFLRDRENEIFDPKCSYYISQPIQRKNKDQTILHELNLQLKNVAMEEEFKQILGKFIVQVSNLFSFTKTVLQ